MYDNVDSNLKIKENDAIFLLLDLNFFKDKKSNTMNCADCMFIGFVFQPIFAVVFDAQFLID